MVYWLEQDRPRSGPNTAYAAVKVHNSTSTASFIFQSDPHPPDIIAIVNATARNSV